MIPKPVIQIAESAAPVVRETLENPAAVLGAFEKSAYEAWSIAPRVADAAIRTVETNAAKMASTIRDAFDPSVYKIAPRSMDAQIRTAENFAAGATNWGDDTAKVADESIPFLVKPVRYQQSLTSGHFAQMIHTDFDAFKAVSKFERPAIGFVPRMVEAEATQEQMQKTAMEGALSYLGKGGTANKFTEYLVGRFGSV
jgi:hypothetical protein